MNKNFFLNSANQTQAVSQKVALFEGRKMRKHESVLLVEALFWGMNEKEKQEFNYKKELESYFLKDRNLQFKMLSSPLEGEGPPGQAADCWKLSATR